ncbi:hypothetical protein HAX54_018007, partial [Datura stramonium]|nr:hypothetical protein [Datura stramonium]
MLLVLRFPLETTQQVSLHKLGMVHALQFRELMLEPRMHQLLVKGFQKHQFLSLLELALQRQSLEELMPQKHKELSFFGISLRMSQIYGMISGSK